MPDSLDTSASLGSSGGFDDILKQIGPLTREMAKTTAPEEKRMRDLLKESDTARADLTRAVNEPTPDMPKMGDLPKRHGTKPENPMDALGNPLTILAIFASSLTRQPLTTALRSAGEAMKGYHAGHVEAAKEAEDEYRDALDATFKQHTSEMETYRGQLEKHGQTIRGKAAVLEAVGSAFGWENEVRLAKAGQIDQALRLLNARDTLMARVKEQGWMNDYRNRTLKARKGAERQQKANIALGNILKLKMGQPVEWGGWTFTPQDFQQMTTMTRMPLEGLNPKQKAMQSMLNDATAAGQPPAGEDAEDGETPTGTAALGAPGNGSVRSSSASPLSYASQTDVVKAYQKGDITRDEAADILRENGWAE